MSEETVTSKIHLAFGTRFCGLFVALALALSPSASAAPQASKLGTVTFPNSCSAEAQGSIAKGVALMHSFQYTEATQTFEEALRREPKCPALHWGKAMAMYEQIWYFPDEKHLKEGRKEIEKAQKLHSRNAREQGFLDAAASFFQKGKLSEQARIQAYSNALERLHSQNPHDPEAGSFYALSLLALSEEDKDHTMEDMKKAVAVLEPLLQEHPGHPGVAHYLIHATDRPELAAQGLEAARRYAAIAPDSSHALHMPSHIFVRLGMWPESIASNAASKTAGAQAAAAHRAESHYQVHAMHFLMYSYLQSGQEAKAREVIEQTKDIVGADQDGKANAHAFFSALATLDLHRWKEAAELPPPPKGGRDTFWARAIGAARSGDVNAAESALKRLDQLIAEGAKRGRNRAGSGSDEKPVDVQEAEAWLAFAKGQTQDALTALRAAADHEDKNGGEGVGVPAREMLADLLLELKHPAEALAEYKANLQTAPNRFDGLLGAARAAQAAGNASAAQSYYAKLSEICVAGADRPELAEAKTYLAQK
jgi:Tfp pilus assembly protein PilF